MDKLKIAIVDVIGLNYDGTTLTKKGLGGSESSIISVAKELVKLNFEVTIFNDCDTDETEPGVYDGVTYLPIPALAERDYGFDIVISQRTVIPFTPIEIYDQVMQPPPRNFDPNLFKQLQRPTQFKIIWMQDTFIWGDHLLEKLVIDGHIDEIFNLSDWHISYTTHSQHGPRRNFEVLKDKIFHTRNAINRWVEWVDIKKKDPNLFVYNASVTKGMEPLVRKIWPKIKAQLPNATLKIIGGYYSFRTDTGVTEAQQKVIDLQKLTENDPSVEFTGIIPQPKIAEIMANATYNLYPGAYPETSGIATLESVNYNTPILGVKFGAMEETGTEAAGYYMDYAIEPNGLFPWIPTDGQIERYVNMVMSVVNNPYLHQQKQYACNNVKDISTWDTVALQWKQHFYNIFGLEQDPDEKDLTDWINYRVHKVFGKRFINPDEVIVAKKPEGEIVPFNNVNDGIKIAIIDIVGMAYDGDTLNRKGLGGSESAVILVSRELAKIGCSVTVFNACNEDDNKPGIYDRVIYRSLYDIGAGDDDFDVVISSRVVTPFITPQWYGYPQTTNRKFHYEQFEKMQKNAKLKVFWMHDTFCWGDDILEDLVHNGQIDEIWTLSDFHSFYVMNAAHPKLRNYEVLRDHMWTTRNGIVKYFDTVDIDAKDPNMFIFNANMSKGLNPLLNGVWPRLKQKLPNARLTVIGGHYKLGAAFAHGDEETEFMKIAGPHFEDPTIKFTGIITQKEVAEYCKKASYFIYPASLPETYGISTMEALYANTPLLTCRFGALEESASSYSYYIDYAIEANSLFPNINANEQIDKFVDMAVAAYNNPAEHRRRMEALDVVKDLLGWEVTALEWKQHLYNKLGRYLSKSESQQARYTQTKYHEVFERRLSYNEEWLAPKQKQEQRIIVLSPFYNAKDYVDRCIMSVAAQDYDNYEHWLFDDASTDASFNVAKSCIDNLPENIRNKFKIFRSNQNNGAVYNHMKMIRETDPKDIIMLLDGDDWLVNRPDVFDYYNKIHMEYEFTYGSCWSVVDNIPLISQPYPPKVKSNRSYKDYRFNWNMPYTHLRTFKSKYLRWEPDEKFQDENGNWFKAGGDNATFYTALKNVDPKYVYVVSDIVYNYNDASPLNDYKVNKEEQDRAINAIVGAPSLPAVVEPAPVTQVNVQQPKRILIAIPTNKNIEAVTFKSIYDLIVPEGYVVDFQYFWGYQVDQVRNLIVHWTRGHNYDYLFAVDSDISFAPDTLIKLLSHDKDLVCGVYIQRIPGTHTIEVMRRDSRGGISHVDWAEIKGKGLVPIDGCGFGCALVKSSMLKELPYPQFLYQSAIDHANTISEDVYFCMKAAEHGFKLWCDTSVICDHTGSWTFTVDRNMPEKESITPIQLKLRNLRYSVSMPEPHVQYLARMRDEMGVNPTVCYDIGSSVLHWTDAASRVWNTSGFVAFEAMDDCEFLYKESNIAYNIGVLSDTDNKVIDFYENKEYPAGNSYYRENPEFSPPAAQLFSDSHRVKKRTMTLDTVVKQKGFPPPDLIKMDVQGAEMDVLKGAQETLKTCNDLILEMQHVEYNKGAPMKDEVIAYVESIGFELVTPYFATASSMDGDYHFRKKKELTK
jgi:FkbM family methyltransferase